MGLWDVRIECVISMSTEANNPEKIACSLIRIMHVVLEFGPPFFPFKFFVLGP